MIRVSWRQHRTNSSILEEVKEQSRLLRIVKCRKLRYFGHVVRAQTLCTSILHGHIDSTRPRGRPSRRWTDDTREWTGTGMTIVECIRTAEDRVAWRAVTSSSTASDLQQWGRTSSSSLSFLWPVSTNCPTLLRSTYRKYCIFNSATLAASSVSILNPHLILILLLRCSLRDIPCVFLQ